MSSRLRNVTFDCADPHRLAEFWSVVTGYREDPENPNEPGDPDVLLVSPEGGTGLLFFPCLRARR